MVTKGDVSLHRIAPSADGSVQQGSTVNILAECGKHMERIGANLLENE
jgi:hypothetical protein